MRNTLFTLSGIAALAIFAAGCAGPEQKLGRGISNTFEITRGGEFTRSIEQTTVGGSVEDGYTTGVVRGFDRTIARTGLGLWEIVTFPFPNHDKSYAPIATKCLSASPAFPDNRITTGLLDGDISTETDNHTGISGGDVAPFLPGSQFTIYDN